MIASRSIGFHSSVGRVVRGAPGVAGWARPGQRAASTVAHWVARHHRWRECACRGARTKEAVPAQAPAHSHGDGRETGGDIQKSPVYLADSSVASKVRAWY